MTIWLKLSFSNAILRTDFSSPTTGRQESVICHRCATHDAHRRRRLAKSGRERKRQNSFIELHLKLILLKPEALRSKAVGLTHDQSRSGSSSRDAELYDVGTRLSGTFVDVTSNYWVWFLPVSSTPINTHPGFKTTHQSIINKKKPQQRFGQTH